MRILLVSGLSGAGKSVALDMLEDLGFYCVDNIPSALLPAFVDLTLHSEEKIYQHIAIGVDARNRPNDIDALPGLVASIRDQGVRCEILFLYADENILVKRYSETRRRHPLSIGDSSLRDALAHERKLLAPLSEAADLVIDTSSTTVHELRELVRARITGRGDAGFSLLFESFGFKHGIPDNADFVFDVRCLPNPYWEAALRPGTGKDAVVAEFLASHDSVARMTDDIAGFVLQWLDPIRKSDRSYLTVAVGCTGGRHRSVYIVEQLAGRFREDHPGVLVRHSAL